MLKLQKLTLSLILLCFLTSCAPNVPDVPACENLQQRLATDPVTGHLMLSPSPLCMEMIGEPECGHCVFTISAKQLFVGDKEPNQYNGKTWTLLKQQSIYLPAKESYAPLATYIINSCNKMGCNDKVDKFKIKLDSLNGIGSLLSGH